MPQSAVIGYLLQQPAFKKDGYHKGRVELRTTPAVVIRLDLRRWDGRTLNALALNVSQTGIGFQCREQLKMREQIQLRLAFEEPAEFEPFTVMRVICSLGGYVVGAKLHSPRFAGLVS